MDEVKTTNPEDINETQNEVKDNPLDKDGIAENLGQLNGVEVPDGGPAEQAKAVGIEVNKFPSSENKNPENEKPIDYMDQLAKANPDYANMIKMQSAAQMVGMMQRSAHMDDKAIIHQTLGEDTSEKDSDAGRVICSCDDLMATYDVEHLNLLELLSLRKKMYTELTQLRSCQEMLSAVDDLITKSDAAEINKETMSANYLEAFGFSDLTRQTFIEYYNEYNPVLTDFVIALDKKIAELREAGVSTKTLTDDMIAIMDKKVASLDHTNPLNTDKIKKYALIRDIYANRCKGSIEFITHAMENILKNKRNCRKMRDALSGPASAVFGKLNSTYERKALSQAIEELDFTMVSFDILPLLYTLNKLVGKNDDNGSKIWVDVFISNLADIRNGIFDIMDPAEWISDVETAFSGLLADLASDVVVHSKKDPISFAVFCEYRNLRDYADILDKRQAAQESENTDPEAEASNETTTEPPAEEEPKSETDEDSSVE